VENMNSEDFPEDVKTLIDLLRQPEEGELNYRGGKRRLSRLEAIKRLKELEKIGIISPPSVQRGTNVHIHTSESFSVFKSPAEAAWAGYRAGLEIFGINDHYTIAGHKEFGEACRILGLKATFSIEAMAMSEEAKKAGERYNDARNPGRTYLCGKGVVHDLEPGSRSERLLKTVRAAFRERCRKMTEKVSKLLSELDPSLNLSFDRVLRLTPHGNVTERHIAQAVTELINQRFPRIESRKKFLAKLIGSFDEEDLSREDKFQDLIRNRMLKGGGPAYVEEPAEAFPSIQDMVQLFRDYGAIPTYPVLGNPVTEKESNLDLLFDELEGYGIYAVEVIPKRNTRKRLDEILKVAEKHGFPVFNGTEHNTKAAEPLLDRFSADPAFLPVFRRGAYLLLGHQFFSRYFGVGYVDSEGRLTVNDREKGISLFSFAGRLDWSEEVLEWLINIGKKNVFKTVVGLHLVLDHEEERRVKVNPGFRVPNRLLRKIKVEDGQAVFSDENAEKEFRRIAKKFIVPD